MNYELVQDNEQLELPVLLQNRLQALIAQLKRLLCTGEFTTLKIADIAKMNDLSVPQLLEFGHTKAELACHVQVDYNQRVIEKFGSQHIKWMALNTPDRIKAYLCALYAYDVEHLILCSELQKFEWQMTPRDDARLNSQHMKIMGPVLYEFHENDYSYPAARTHAVWGLYKTSLRLSNVKKASPKEFIDEIDAAINVIC